MISTFFKRYALVVCAAVYTAALIGLHVLGKFPAPGLYDVSRLAGSPVLTLQGRVIHFPQTRWSQTRFLLEGHAEPLEAFQGRVLVNLSFPMEDLAPGEKLRVRGWLSVPRQPSLRRPFDERAYWAGYRAFAILRVWSPEALKRLEGSGHTMWSQRAWVYHQRMKQFWFDHLPPEEAAVLSCMTMGSRGILPMEIKNQCIRAGVYHMLVVSGQNMALIIAVGVGCLRLLRIPRRRAFWMCSLPIVFYTCAVGADPPVTRAAAMALAALAAAAMGRDTPGYYPFVLAWLWILLREPEALFGASFHLSFGATASLLAWVRWIQPLRRIPSRWLRWLAEAGALSLAVHAGVGPLLVYYFRQISLAGVVTNVIFFPLSGCIMVVGLLLGTWGVYVPGSVPEPLLDGVHRVLQQMLWAIQWTSEWRWAAVPLPAPSWTACGVYYGLLICILFKLHHAEK